jgi:hypothetical protein
MIGNARPPMALTPPLEITSAPHAPLAAFALYHTAARGSPLDTLHTSTRALRSANRRGVIEIREGDFACKVAMAIVVSGYPRVYRRFRAAGS